MALQQRPDTRVPEAGWFLTVNGIANLDPLIAFSVRKHATDRMPVTRRYSRELAWPELRLPHPAGRPSRTPQPFIRRNMPFSELSRNATKAGLPFAEPSALIAFEILRSFMQPEHPRHSINAGNRAVEQLRDLPRRTLRVK
jgi:hypothetical protein